MRVPDVIMIDLRYRKMSSVNYTFLRQKPAQWGIKELLLKTWVINHYVKFCLEGFWTFYYISYGLGCQMLRNGEDKKFLSLLAKKLCCFVQEHDFSLITDFKLFFNYLSIFLVCNGSYSYLETIWVKTNCKKLNFI